MNEAQTRAERWLNACVRDRVRHLRFQAAWHVLIGLVACGIWWVCVVGTLFAIWFTVRFAGISLPYPPYVGVGVYLFQLGLFFMVRRKQAQWEITEDIEGNVLVVPPEHSAAAQYVYNQDHDFSFRKVYVSLFFAAPIAFDEAIRAWKEAGRLKRLDYEPAAQLATILLDEQKKLTFGELKQSWLGSGFKEAIHQAAELPGFHLFSKDPQGVALTDAAVSELLAE
jgi:hypothetical protein